MQTDIQCPYGHGPMVRISIYSVTDLMNKFTIIANKYINARNGYFATQAWEEFSSFNAHVKHQIYLLSTVDEDSAIEAAEKFEKERASRWKNFQRLAPSSVTQVESSEVKTQGDQAKTANHLEQQASKSGASSGDTKNKVEPLVLREARKAVTDYIKVCKEEIREQCTDRWSLLEDSLSTIDQDYKKTRDIVKKAIEVAPNTAEDESKRGDKKEAEELLKKLRGVWQDARQVFLDGRGEDYYDSGLEEEVDMGFFV